MKVNFTVLFCLLSGFSPILGMSLKNNIPYSATIGWGLSIVFILCAAISATLIKKREEQRKIRS